MVGLLTPQGCTRLVGSQDIPAGWKLSLMPWRINMWWQLINSLGIEVGIYNYKPIVWQCIYIYTYSRFPVRYPRLPTVCYLQHSRVTAFHLHAICSVSKPRPSTCTLFTAFESRMLPTYDDLRCPSSNVGSICFLSTWYTYTKPSPNGRFIVYYWD